MPDMKMHMPNLARHEGVWDGVYRYYDANGDKVDDLLQPGAEQCG